VNDTEFSVTDPASTSGNRVVKELQTSITLANNETAVLGGLIKNDTTETELLGTPFARIPFVGWLLGKIKTQVKTTSSILIFITPEILPPSDRRVAREFTSERIADIGKTFHLTEHPYQRIDPIHNLFFGDSNTHSEIFDQYIAEEGKYTYKRQKKEIRSSSRTSHDKSLGDYL
jgi:Flp pilus assembly secretin CpaC